MLYGCGSNISWQLCRNGPQVLCCPTKVMEVVEVREVKIAFSHILWNTGACWRLTGFKTKNSPPYDAINSDWKVAISENRAAAITETGSVVLWDKESKWRLISFQRQQEDSQWDFQDKDLGKSHGDSVQLPEEHEGGNVERNLKTVQNKNERRNIDKKSKCKKLQELDLELVAVDSGLISDACSSSSSLDNKETKKLKQSQRIFQKLNIEDNALLAIDSDGVAYSSNIPVQVGRQQVSEIALGKEHCMVLTTNGQVYAWGGGMRGQLGTGELHFSDVPLQVENLHGLYIKSISCGGWHSTALSDTGDVYVWGWNESGQLGYPFKTKEKTSLCFPLGHRCQCPQSVYQEVSSCFVDGEVCEAQENENKVPLHDYKRLKIQGKDKRINPERPKDVLNVQASPKLLSFWVESLSLSDVKCGDQHTLFLLDDGSVWSAGMNKYGQLGLGHTESYDEPAEVPIKNVTKIFAGGWNSIFVTR
ncbi:probable E3 ubiquitin-protein ligase HERC3 [Palaemon carinicauda]|uniref:probable E3 ubiquitin-protein ligase HERC3 n=1 Tax=Palaemon carinicauda TaxID=392227 RepID=UPI0035B5C6FE